MGGRLFREVCSSILFQTSCKSFALDVQVLKDGDCFNDVNLRVRYSSFIDNLPEADTSFPR